MDGERRIEVLKAEAQRLREQLQKIDREVLDLYGKDGHGTDPINPQKTKKRE